MKRKKVEKRNKHFYLLSYNILLYIEDLFTRFSETYFV